MTDGTILLVEKCSRKAYKPQRAHKGDAGLDLTAPRGFRLQPGEFLVIPLGLKVAIPEGYTGCIIDKSGMAKKGITIYAFPPIDAGYRGEIHAFVRNISKKEVRIERGEEFCQLIILPITSPAVQLVKELPNTSDGRGEHGLGSKHKTHDDQIVMFEDE